MQLPRRKNDMFTTILQQHLNTTIRLIQQPQTLHQLWQISRPHRLQRDSNDRRTPQLHARKIDSGSDRTNGSVFQDFALETADAKDVACGDRVEGDEFSAHDEVEGCDGDEVGVFVGMVGGVFWAVDVELLAYVDGPGV